jgi:hypothetical protein
LEFDPSPYPSQLDEQSTNTIYSLINSRAESSDQLFRDIDNKIWNELSMSDSIREAVRKEKFQEKNNKRTNTTDAKNILSLSDPPSSNIRCKFFSSGSCKNGTHCPYLHISEEISPLPFKMEFEDKSKRPVCKFYLMGNGACKKGDQCQFRHELESTSTPPPPPVLPPKNITFEPSEWPSLPASKETTTPSVVSQQVTTGTVKKPTSTMASMLVNSNVPVTSTPPQHVPVPVDKPYNRVKEFQFSNMSNASLPENKQENIATVTRVIKEVDKRYYI